MTCDEFRDIFSKYPNIIKDFDVFVERKTAYIKEESIENSLAMKEAYMDIFTDLKISLSNRVISDDTFWKCKEFLQSFD